MSRTARLLESSLAANAVNALMHLVELSDEGNRLYMDSQSTEEEITNSDLTYTIGIESMAGVMHLCMAGIGLSNLVFLIQITIPKLNPKRLSRLKLKLNFLQPRIVLKTATRCRRRATKSNGYCTLT